jgi:DNA-binding LacI/PurR family transcriptional regulator
MSLAKVAKLAGVSSSTVSRVINNHPRVAPSTERTVRTAMAELAYVPSERRPGPKSQSRLKSETKNIALLVFGASTGQSTPAFSGLLRGVSMGATENNLNLSFNYVPNPDQLPSRIIDQGIDGVLLHGARPGADAERRLRTIPAVWLMGNRRRPEWGDQVLPDSYEIGHLAAQYLLRAGHTELAFLNLDADSWPFRQYCLAFTAAAAEHNIKITAVEQTRQTSTDYWQSYHSSEVDAIVSRFMNLSPRPTGVFVADDIQVAAIQPALQHAGLKLGPGHTQIISCNNEKPYLMGLAPRPAVVDIRVESIGRRGVEQLIWRMSHPHVNDRIISGIGPVLIEQDDVRMVDNSKKLTSLDTSTLLSV